MNFLKNIFYLFYPNVCLSCNDQLGENEKDMCLNCRFDLPLTNFSSQKENTLEQTFYGRIPIEFGAALFYYNREGVVQNLIHKLKYNGKQDVGILLGVWFGDELLKSDRTPKFDYVVSVPLHANKLKSRGYNQVSKFGKELSKILNVPYNDTILLRKLDSKTQTSKERIDRFENLKEKFHISDKEIFKGKHILIIDDVITTGATIEACALKLLQVDGIKISVATMAFTA